MSIRYFIFSTWILLSPFGYSQILDTEHFKELKYRNIGPFRGGRSLAVCGHPSQPDVFYFGAVGGGIWQTGDGGKTWFSISDSVFKSSSVGAIAQAPSDPKIIYAGMGETDIRGNISYGDGMYKSVNGGKKWFKIGLEKTFAISNIVVHPKNPDVLYVSALGNVFKPNPDRGVYRSKDGGKTWQKVLFVSDSTGCIQVTMNPSNPDVLYAGMWQAYRTPWSMSSGGRQSGMYKSVDGGETWVNISKNPGLPKGILGKICIAVSPVDGDRVFAMIENTHGGLFRSDDDGATWKKITEEQAIRQRPWYFSSVHCDPKNKDIVYVLNVAYHKSTDGGRTFSSAYAEHADHHDLWINPEQPQIMIMANDGGATISYNGGLNWSHQDIPTAQFYHVTLDNQFPYHIYGAQQDNTSIAISSRSFGWDIGSQNWYTCSWGESGYIAPHPFKPKVAFGGNYSGAIFRYDKLLNHTTHVNVYPEIGLGNGADKLKYRFQWTFPILFSPFSTSQKTILYATSQHVHRSFDEGLNWETISPDLTRNDKSRQISSGGPITKDNTGVETYNTIFTFAESPLEQGVLWAGTDDGLVHLSTDNGANWKQVTPPQISEHTLISILEPSHFKKEKLYLAANRFKLGVFGPVLLKSEDFGKTWIRIDNGLPKNSITRVIREDPSKEGLLFCGTETGVYISFNDGALWQPFQQNLPITPIHDIAIHPKEHDLILATHGRGFWIMDNLGLLYELMNTKDYSKQPLVTCRNTVQAPGGYYEDPSMQQGVNAPCGIVLDYYLPEASEKELILHITGPEGDSVTSFSSLRDKDFQSIPINADFYEPKTTKPVGLLPAQKGFNRFVWNMGTANLVSLKGSGQTLWGASLNGPMANPGIYRFKLMCNNQIIGTVQCNIEPDPRFETVQIQDYQDKKQWMDSVIHMVNNIHQTVNQMRGIRNQIQTFNQSLDPSDLKDSLIKLGKQITDSIHAIENELVQTRANNVQDLLNYPMKLNNRLAILLNYMDDFKGKVPTQHKEAYVDLALLTRYQLQRYARLKKQEITSFNRTAARLREDVIKLKN